MPKTAVPDWAAIRHRYEETDAAVAAIAADAGITRADLDKARKREKWIRRNPRSPPPGRRPPADNPAVAATSRPPGASPKLAAAPAPGTNRPRRGKTRVGPGSRRGLLDRLAAAISLKLEQLERRMAKDLDDLESRDAATATDHERETRAIGALIDNLGKVTEMETGLDRSSKSGKSGPATADIAGEADRYRRELAERLAKIVGTAEGTA